MDTILSLKLFQIQNTFNEITNAAVLCGMKERRLNQYSSLLFNNLRANQFCWILLPKGTDFETVYICSGKKNRT
jgi:hypothetical protein